MSGQVAPAQRNIDDMTPREIVRELDRFVVGQERAKRAVAIALRNRIRRRRLPDELAEDVMPKNILMIGPTGVGKTEIARRLANRCVWRPRPPFRSVCWIYCFRRVRPPHVRATPRVQHENRKNRPRGSDLV
jgi:hypothetical protein